MGLSPGLGLGLGGWSVVVVFSGGGSAADGGPDGGEGGVGVLAEGRDGADADDDDQGEHDGVLDRGRAVFRLQELDDILRELTHGSVSGFGSGWSVVVTQLPIAPFSATLLNVLLAFCPSSVMLPMQTTTIRASMTAYSTAVGP